MHIVRAVIENFRGFVKTEIDLKPGVNIIIGDNGSGKSSLLEAVSVGLAGLLKGVIGVKSIGIQIDQIRMVTESVDVLAASRRYMTPVKLEEEISLDAENNCIIQRERRSENRPETSVRYVQELGNVNGTHYFTRITNDSSSELPIMLYQGIDRVWKKSDKSKSGGETLTKSTSKQRERRFGYADCFSSTLNVKDIYEWCFLSELSSIKNGNEIRQYHAFLDIVAKFMKEINELEKEPSLSFSILDYRMYYTEYDEIHSIDELSDGYQSLLWIVMDIAYRMAILNPEKKRINETSGVVIIDEIDLHLHPKWQRNVLNALNKTFPNVQFIVATHSPIIASSFRGAHVMRMEQDHSITVLEDTYAHTVNEVLDGPMQASYENREISELASRVNKLIIKKDYDHAERALSALAAIAGHDHPTVMAQEAFLRNSRWRDDKDQ